RFGLGGFGSSAGPGYTVIPDDTVLERLHFYDGLFLNGEKLGLEQSYGMTLVQLANQAGGSGIVYGFDATLSTAGDQLTLGPGFAIDPEGRPLLLASPIAPIPLQSILDSAKLVLERDKLDAASGTFGECDFAQLA